MYNPHQFDNSANMGPTALAVCLKSMIFLLMVVVIVGLGYWVWWLHQNRLAFPLFEPGDVVYYDLNGVATPAIVREPHLVREEIEEGRVTGYWDYDINIAGGIAATAGESELQLAGTDGESVWMQEDEKVRRLNRTEREMKAGNLHEQWEQDGRRQ